MITYAAGSECGIGNDFVLVRASRRELFDPAISGLLSVSVLGAFLEGLLGLSQELIHPVMNQTGLNPQLLGELRNRFLPAQMPIDNRSFLLSTEMTTCSTYGIVLQSGYAKPNHRQIPFPTEPLQTTEPEAVVRFSQYDAHPFNSEKNAEGDIAF